MLLYPMRNKRSITIDEGLETWVEEKAKENHTNFSNELNQILWGIKNGSK